MSRWIFGLASAAALAATAAAQHADIIVNVAGNQLWTASDFEPNVPLQVFDGALNELGIPGYTDDPGFNSASLAPSSLLGYNLHGPLFYWDGSSFVAPPAGERIEFANNGVPQAVVDGDDGFVAGANFVQATGGGGLHKHLQFTVQHPTYNPANPFNNPITVGAFAIRVELTSSVHDASEPFVLIFNNQLDETAFETAVAAAADLLGAAECVGDVDGNQTVDLDDLLLVLGSFGTTYDLDDLLLVLGNFGVNCNA